MIVVSVAASVLVGHWVSKRGSRDMRSYVLLLSLLIAPPASRPARVA